MNAHDPLWIPSEGHRPAFDAPTWIDEVERIFADNTDVGQVTPGGREHRQGKRVVRPYIGRVFWGGARFRTTANLEREGHRGALARVGGGRWGSIGRTMHGVPLGATGAIVPTDQVRRSVDHLISRMAPSFDADTGIDEWSLAIARVGGEHRFGVWLTASQVVGRTLEERDAAYAEELSALAEVVDVECAFGFWRGRPDDEQVEVCTFWGPDGRWLTDVEGAVYIENFDELDELRAMSQQRVRIAGNRASDASD